MSDFECENFKRATKTIRVTVLTCSNARRQNRMDEAKTILERGLILALEYLTLETSEWDLSIASALELHDAIDNFQRVVLAFKDRPYPFSIN